MSYESALVTAALFIGGGFAIGLAIYAAFYALVEGIALSTVLVLIAFAELPILIGAYAVFGVGLL